MKPPLPSDVVDDAAIEAANILVSMKTAVNAASYTKSSDQLNKQVIPSINTAVLDITADPKSPDLLNTHALASITSMNPDPRTIAYCWTVVPKAGASIMSSGHPSTQGHRHCIALVPRTWTAETPEGGRKVPLKLALLQLPKLYTRCQEPTEFVGFSNLPLELRRMVWKYASHQSRNICLYQYMCRTFRLFSPKIEGQAIMPAILQISAESRAEALKYFRVTKRHFLRYFGDPQTGYNVSYINPKSVENDIFEFYGHQGWNAPFFTKPEGKLGNIHQPALFAFERNLLPTIKHIDIQGHQINDSWSGMMGHLTSLKSVRVKYPFRCLNQSRTRQWCETTSVYEDIHARYWNKWNWVFLDTFVEECRSRLAKGVSVEFSIVRVCLDHQRTTTTLKMEEGKKSK